MEKKTVITCPYCMGKEICYIQASGEEKVYQCSECSRYFKVQVGVSVNQIRARATKI